MFALSSCFCFVLKMPCFDFICWNKMRDSCFCLTFLCYGSAIYKFKFELRHFLMSFPVTSLNCWYLIMTLMMTQKILLRTMAVISRVIPWNGVTLDNFSSFYLFSSLLYLCCHAAFGKEYLVLRGQLSGSVVLLCTHNML